MKVIPVTPRASKLDIYDFIVNLSFKLHDLEC